MKRFIIFLALTPSLLFGGATIGSTGSGGGFTAGGDLTGTSTSQTVAKINGNVVTGPATQAQQIAGTSNTVFSTPLSVASAASLIGPSLSYTVGTPGTLDAIQDIRTTASPTWAGVNSGSITLSGTGANVVVLNGNAPGITSNTSGNSITFDDGVGNMTISATGNLNLSGGDVLDGGSGGSFGTPGDRWSQGFFSSLSVTGTTISSAGIGYATGSGGTITQGTSRTTGVTLNKASGAITLFTATGSVTATTFTVTDSLVAVGDTIIFSVTGATNVYEVFPATNVTAGTFNITFETTGGVSSDTPVFHFTVIKGSSN